LLLRCLDSAPVFTGVTRRNDLSLAYPVIPAKAGIQVCSPYLLSLYVKILIVRGASYREARAVQHVGVNHCSGDICMP